jgi:multidrug efflux system outer membrane protein
VDVEVPEGWKLGQETEHWKLADPKDQVVRVGWWMIFDDPILDALEKQAVDYNQDLKRAAANFEKARALARVDKADFFPDITLNPSIERFRRTKNSFTSTSASTNSFISESYSVPFDLSYEIDLWGRVRRAYEAGAAEADAAYENMQAVLLSITADVARNYFAIRELDKELEIIDKAIELRKYANDVVSQRVEAGLTSDLDFNRAKTELAKAKTDRIGVLRQRAQLESALAVLCGQLAPQFVVEHRALDMPVPVLPLVMPSTLLERRPDIAEAERNMQAANAKIGVAKAAFFPVLTLTGYGGFESISMQNLFNWESHVWSMGPGVSFPIFRGGRNKAELQAAIADYELSIAEYRQAILNAFSEVEASLHNLSLGAEEAKAQDEVVVTARAAANLSIDRYKQGLVTFLEVIDAERSRLDAELEATRVLNLRLVAAIQLIKALGGGWENHEDQ